jgi:N-acetylglucosamine kinase-like BadF-type ATPase
MTIVAGIDIGGSGMRVLASDGVRESRHRIDRAMQIRSAIDPAGLADDVADLLARSLPEGATVAAVCVGMTGFPGLVEDPEPIARRIIARVATPTVMIAGDALTTHVGALSMDAGVVVAAGTGVIALGTDFESTWNRADGWGHLAGDLGSGAWIGRMGIEAGLREHDGRPGGSTALLRLLRDRYGDVPALLDRLYRSTSPAFELARFAPLVADAARGGDVVARSIWRAASEHLADSAVAASRGIEPLFSWGGGLFAAEDLLLDHFRQAVVDRLPEARFTAPRGGSLEGALLLAQRQAAEPMPTASAFLRSYTA